MRGPPLTSGLVRKRSSFRGRWPSRLLPRRWTTPAVLGQPWKIGLAHRPHGTALGDAPIPTDQKVGIRASPIARPVPAGQGAIFSDDREGPRCCQGLDPSRLLDDVVDLGQCLAALPHVVVAGASGLCHTHELTNVKASGELDGIVVANRPLSRYAVAPAIPACIGMTNATSRCP